MPALVAQKVQLEPTPPPPDKAALNPLTVIRP